LKEILTMLERDFNNATKMKTLCNCQKCIYYSRFD